MKPTLLIAAAAAFTAAAAGAAAQETGDSTARREFFAAKPSETQNAYIGLKTSLLLRTQNNAGECQFREVPEDYEFSKSEAFRLRLQSNASGYVYIVARGVDGKFQLLYPVGGSIDTTSRLERFQTVTIPEKDWFKSDQKSDSDRMYVFLSPKPVKEFEKILQAGKPVRSGELQKLVDRADQRAAGTYEFSGPDGDLGSTYTVADLVWKSDLFLRRFRFRNYGR